MDDIIKPKKSLKEIIPKEEIYNPLRKKTPVPPINEPHDYGETSYRPRRRKSKGWLVIVVVILFLMGGVFVGTNVFSYVSVNVTPKTASAENINEKISASLNPADGQISFATMISPIEETETTYVLAGNTKKVETKAKGTVTIYNNFSKTAQPLVAGTRLADKNGLVFRTAKTISVPGLKGTGKDTVPGSATVDVAADLAGEKYNVGVTDFTIVAFKGSPRYDKIYARSKTDIAGGKIGEEREIAEADRKKAETELRAKLSARLVERAKKEIPTGKNLVLYPDAVFITYTETIGKPKSSDPKMVEFTEKASISGILFDEAELAKYLAGKLVKDYKGDDVRVVKPEELKITLANKDKIDIKTVSNVSLSVAGKAKFVWTIDEGKLAKSLEGKEKKGLEAVYAEFPGIESVRTSFKPSWMGSVPADPQKIKITITEAK